MNLIKALCYIAVGILAIPLLPLIALYLIGGAMIQTLKEI